MQATEQITRTVERMSPGRAVVASLLAHGVDTVFGLDGSHVIQVFDALADAPSIAPLTFKHENNAAIAAEMYGRLTGRPGVVVVTAGPGATNSLSGIGGAYAAGAPVVHISGGVPVGAPHEAFHGVDGPEFIQDAFKGVTKWSTRVEDASEIPAALAKAFEIAVSGPAGADARRDRRERAHRQGGRGRAGGAGVRADLGVRRRGRPAEPGRPGLADRRGGADRDRGRQERDVPAGQRGDREARRAARGAGGAHLGRPRRDADGPPALDGRLVGRREEPPDGAGGRRCGGPGAWSRGAGRDRDGRGAARRRRRRSCCSTRPTTPTRPRGRRSGRSGRSRRPSRSWRLRARHARPHRRRSTPARRHASFSSAASTSSWSGTRTPGPGTSARRSTRWPGG